MSPSAARPDLGVGAGESVWQRGRQRPASGLVQARSSSLRCCNAARRMSGKSAGRGDGCCDAGKGEHGSSVRSLLVSGGWRRKQEGKERWQICSSRGGAVTDRGIGYPAVSEGELSAACQFAASAACSAAAHLHRAGLELPRRPCSQDNCRKISNGCPHAVLGAPNSRPTCPLNSLWRPRTVAANRTCLP